MLLEFFEPGPDLDGDGLSNAQEQHAWAGDTEVKSEREFDIFKFSYFLHEMETLEKRKSEKGEKK